MHCAECKKRVSTNANFCGFCGSKISRHVSKDELKFNVLDRKLSKNYPQSKTVDSIRYSTNIEDEKICFVLGLPMYRDQRMLDWISKNCKDARIVNFSNRSVVQRLVYDLGKNGKINGLCLIGSARSIPPFIVGNVDDASTGFAFESDAFYASQVQPLNELPGSAAGIANVHKRFERLGADDLIGVVPVGRIPTDDPDVALSYLSALKLPGKSGRPFWLCVSAADAEWMSESESVLRYVGANATFATAPTATERTLSYHASLAGLSDRLIGSNLIVNLHGEAPGNGRRQLLIGDPQGLPYVDLADLGNVAHSTSFLFSCYGGHSGWWEDGIIGNFLAARARAVVASSGAVFTTDLTRPSGSFGAYPPGAVQLCASFFEKIHSGFNYGQALSIAKSETIIDAIELGPQALAIALKEITQFSLFGAPWAKPFYSDDNEFTQLQRSVTRNEGKSLIDRVRSGVGASSHFSASAGLLNRMRANLRERLSTDVFYGHHHLSASRLKNQRSQIPIEVISSLSTLHTELDDLVCDSVEVSGNLFYIFSDASSSRSKDHATLMDSAGHVLGRYNLKGTS